MTILNHILGFPRIGEHRELKYALENYWNGKISKIKLLNIGKKIRYKNWKKQKKCGIDLLPVGDFSWYDHVLTTSLMLGNIPERYKNNKVNIDTLFLMSRGGIKNNKIIVPSEMTKWFNTNYHYIVPEFIENQKFSFSWNQLLEEIDEALILKHKIKPIILGPLTYLWLGKKKENFNKLKLLDKILPVYKYLLYEIKKRKIEWIQIDEPILVLDLPEIWKKSFKTTYDKLQGFSKILLTTYFDSIKQNIDIISTLSVNGIHIDLISGNDSLDFLHKNIPNNWILSLGIINGRNIWKTNLCFWFRNLQKLKEKNRKLWISSSCSLLHTPIDLSYETHLNKEIKKRFSFAIQKCEELSLLSQSLNKNDINILKDWNILSKNKKIEKKISNINLNRKNNFVIRNKKQKKYLNLPILPTTTIGSFPQTKEIRILRMNFKKNKISEQEYERNMFKHIKKIIHEQELLDLDVLVHGEVERNDMVEYFGENLNGFISTKNAWVQSYGSRCVKPPIIIGDISRKKPITLKWILYAQSLTKKPVKAMLTGPITILSWSFPREDISKEIIAQQIALSLKEEVLNLEKSGIRIIQIDEPAFREGLPLKKSQWKEYLIWAANNFRLSCSTIKDITQIHTHMCYSEFNDIMPFIATLDADVITIESSRSNMKLLQSFKKFQYPNAIGPGVYDIHSKNVPDVDWIISLLLKANKYIPIKNLWVNPDCGLKTRTWKETRNALKNMVIAAKNLRNSFKKNPKNFIL